MIIDDYWWLLMIIDDYWWWWWWWLLMIIDDDDDDDYWLLMIIDDWWLMYNAESHWILSWWHLSNPFAKSFPLQISLFWSQGRQVAIQAIALFTCHEGTIAFARCCDDAETLASKVPETASTMNLPVVAIHVVVGIPRAILKNSPRKAETSSNNKNTS